MKKIFICFVFIMLLFSLSSCVEKVDKATCNHTWGEGIELESGKDAFKVEYTCTVCGETKEEIVTIIPEKKFCSVREGIDNLEKIEKFTFEFSLSQIYSDNETEEMFSVIMKNDGKNQKIEMSILGESFTFYTVVEINENNEEVVYLIFDTSIISPDLDGYVKASMNEITELFFGIQPDFPNDENEENNEMKELEDTANKLKKFFLDLKDEYFDINEEEWFVFNQKGKDEFENVVNDFEDAISGAVSTPYKLDLEIELKVKTNKENITDIHFDLIGNNVETNDTEIMRFLCSLNDFNDVKVNIPTNVMSLEEFIERMQNNNAPNVGTWNLE